MERERERERGRENHSTNSARWYDMKNTLDGNRHHETAELYK
jgi:hypothetical protein